MDGSAGGGLSSHPGGTDEGRLTAAATAFNLQSPTSGGPQMPQQPHVSTSNAAHPAPTSPVVLQSAAVPSSSQAATLDAYQAGQRPAFGPGPGEEITTVLPRRPVGFATPAPTSATPGMPVWGPPPRYSAPMPPRPQPRRRPPLAWMTAGAAVVATAVCAGLVINFASSSDRPADVTIGAAPTSSTTSTSPSPSSAPEATMPLSALPGVLLDVGTLNSMLGATNLAPRADVSENDTKAFTGGDNDHPECGGVHNAALQRELDNSGYVAVRIQAVSDPHLTENIVDDGAIYYSTAKAANDFVAKQAQAWAKCNGVTLHPDPADGIWMVGTVANRGGMVSVISTQEGAEGWQCQRALTARNNVVIDVNSCGFNRTDQAIAIATRMADRVTPR